MRLAEKIGFVDGEQIDQPPEFLCRPGTTQPREIPVEILSTTLLDALDQPLIDIIALVVTK